MTAFRPFGAKVLLCAALLLCDPATARPQHGEATVHAALRRAQGDAHPKQAFPPAVLWLEPEGGLKLPPFQSAGPYVLLQKNKTFSPHLLVIPVGAAVSFPNRDPFFHNVFSLFDGKRFDLGLYEAGKTRDVVFPREGVSYIFCNIHPEMSAVVISLSTPLYAIVDAGAQIAVPNVPAGDYTVHLWVEGQSSSTMEHWRRHVHIAQADQDLGVFQLQKSAVSEHLNKFGQTYDTKDPSQY